MSSAPAAPDSTSIIAPAAAASVDVPAVRRILGRLGAAPQAPWLHQEVGRRMAERLVVFRRAPQRVLDWWSFTGGSATLLAQVYPQAEHLRVEPLPGLQAAGERQAAAGQDPPGRWLGSAQAVGVNADLVWANLMLHAVAEPQVTLRRWHQALAVEGWVMFSALGPDTARELRAVHRDGGWGEAGCEFTDLHDWGDLLVASGFADPVMDMERITLTWPDAAAMQRELRALGGNAHVHRHAGLRTPRWQARWEAAMEARRGRDGRLAMSFEVIYGHAFKPAPRVRLQEETRIGLDAMRGLLKPGR
jgi:malonyl-CoA O-methyltransferase